VRASPDLRSERSCASGAILWLPYRQAFLLVKLVSRNRQSFEETGMRWREERSSTNVEDRRGMGGGMGGLGIPIGPGIGGGGAIALLIVAMLFGVNPSEILGPSVGTGPGMSTGGGSGQDDELAQFASKILGDTEDTWNAIFQSMGRTYEDPHMVLYSG